MNVQNIGMPHAFAAVADFTAKLTEWRDGLAQVRAMMGESFNDMLLDMKAGSDDFAEAADNLLVTALSEWCERREEWTRNLVNRLDPETVVTMHVLGRSAELGEVIGGIFDEAVRELDTTLQGLIAARGAQL